MKYEHIIIAAVFAAAACTTEFNTDEDGDGSSDTTGETSSDGTDIPDGADTTPDVEPDGPPPGHVVCSTDRDVYVWYDSDLRVPWGCPTVGDCRDTDFWMGFSSGNLVVISGGEGDGVSPDSGGLFAGAVLITESELTSDGAQQIPLSFPDGHSPRYDSGSLILNHEDELILLYAVREWGGSSLTNQYIDALSVRAGTDGSITTDGWQFMSDLPATTEPDPINNIRAIRHGDDAYVFYNVEHDLGMGPAPGQMFGGTFSLAEILAGGEFDHGTEFHALQPTRDHIDYPLSPGIALGRVVLPMIRLVLTGMTGDYFSSVWSFDGPIPSSGAHNEMDFESTESFAGSTAASGLGPDGDLAAAALSSNEQFSMTGMDPPYVLNVAMTGSPDDTTLVGERVTNVNDPSIREMDHFDLKDPKIFYDDVMGIFHYVIVLFPAGRNATVHVYSFFPDGTPATEAAMPFTFETGSATLPAFDTVMSPETGRIYVVVYPGDETSGSADGYYVTEIACDLITE
ncbi:MAG: hypothetical protein JRG91_03055 [Deltaproteobacteria bacterium]|nr:hypothetical protein [Deltaproteobacteria bacterium]